MFYAGIGSRETPAEYLRIMTAIARKLAADGYTLRSGAAAGADSAFEAGAGDRKEIYIPWLGFNKSKSRLLPTPEAFTMAKQFHPAWAKCSRGARALHARNCHQVLGLDLKTPVKFIVCWTKDGLRGGGTGQALRIAAHHQIPIHDLGRPIVACTWAATGELPDAEIAA